MFMTSLNAMNLTDVLPVFRSQTYEDIIQGNYGDIHKVWLVPGHVLVSCDHGSKLFSLDCIPASRQQNSADQCPAFENFSPPVLDVMVTELYADVIFIVQENGHVQCWRYTEMYTWDSVMEFDVCNTTGTDVVSVCLHRSHSMIYWCERRTSTNLNSAVYCVCKRSLPQEVSSLKTKNIGSAVAMVHNCPASDVFAVGNSLFISSRHDADSVHVSLVINPDVNHVTLFVGDSTLEMSKLPSAQVVDFRTLLLRSISAVAKNEQLTGVIDVKYDHRSQTVAVVYADGKFRLYHATEENPNDISVTLGSLPHPPSHIASNQWFVTKNLIGVVNGNTIRMFDVNKECPLPEVTSPDNSVINGVIMTTSLTVVAGFHTNTDFYLIQSAVKNKNHNDFPAMSEGRCFQTDGLHIAYLNQMRDIEQTPETLHKLNELHTVWTDEQTRQPKSKLSHLVDPYLCEFWRLEEMFGKVGNVTAMANSLEDASLSREISDCISANRSQSLVKQEASLLWMSERFPEELLQVLTDQLQFDTDVVEDDVSPADMSNWHRVLGLDGNVQVEGGSNSLFFDHICRLLFKLDPYRLTRFVKCAQIVSEQTIGVSAFVRRKQTSLFYKKALSCLPDPNMSCDPSLASQVTAQLILACGDDHGPERALKLLLHHHQWQTAINLVKQQSEKSHLRACLLYITLSELAQHQVLAQFAEDIFSMVPTWQSFVTLSDVITEQPDVKQSQLTSSASAITCQGPPDVPLGAIRPFLLQLLHQYTTSDKITD